MDLYLPTHRVEAALGHDALLAREWLLTNGTGSYSMGTALGCNTRRYHGLLVAATRPPVGRVLALNQVIDELSLHAPGDKPDHGLQLASSLFPADGGLVHHPFGDGALSHFERGVTAAWTYTGHGLTVTRQLVLHHHAPAVTLRYTLAGEPLKHHDSTFRLAPLLTLRDFHALSRRDDHPSFEMSVEPHEPTATFRRGPHSLTMHGPPAAAFDLEPDWWYDLAYPLDTRRGQDDREDAFAPGSFTVRLGRGSERHDLTFTATLGTSPAAPAGPHDRVKHLRPMLDRLPGDARRRSIFALAADDFVVARTVGERRLSTILAGFPWFADWGRDTFIALPGLLLCTGRHDEAGRVLRAFANSLRDGLVPNRFNDYEADTAEYNTLDASLWFVHAGLAYLAATAGAPGSSKAKAGAKRTGHAWLTRAMRSVVDAYAAGTTADSHHGEPIAIRMDDDGLITAGHGRSQLTWMDAAVGDTVFTPRPGKCVEINALWHSALVGLADHLDPTDPGSADCYRALAARVATSFVNVFVRDGQPGLIDHVTPDGTADPAVRPNQIFAASLERSPLPDRLKPGVVETVRQHLLTPGGLRTLPPDDPDYHPTYGGPQAERDSAYHRGTVWPWLIGPYAEAVLRAGKFSKASRAEPRAALGPLLDHLEGPGLGQLPELFDADVTADTLAAKAKGTSAQAWSVAEVLRVLMMIEAA